MSPRHRMRGAPPRPPGEDPIAMPTYVNPNKYDGCKALERPACMYICPMDLMTLDTATGKGFNQETVYQRIFTSPISSETSGTSTASPARSGFFGAAMPSVLASIITG